MSQQTGNEPKNQMEFGGTFKELDAALQNVIEKREILNRAQEQLRLATEDYQRGIDKAQEIKFKLNDLLVQLLPVTEGRVRQS